MVDLDPGVSMQKPNGSREYRNAEPIYSTEEAVGGGGNEVPSAIGGGAELGGRNEALGAIGGGADLGGGNGGHAATPKSHRNEVVTMLEADTILNERSIVKVEQNSYLKIMQVTDEVQKNLELRQIEQRILNSKKSKDEELIYNIAKSKLSFNEQTSYLELLNTWHHNNDKRYLNHCLGALIYITSVFLKLLIGGKKLGMSKNLSMALLEGVEMPQDRDEIYIEQTKEEQLQLLEMYEGSSIMRTSKRVHPLSPTGSDGNVEIVIGDNFQLSNDLPTLKHLGRNKRSKWPNSKGFSMELPCSLLLLLSSQYYTS
ncbi:hypothetical protein SELMODRAFT_431352 [Selaginella moellendorffii]|uniref:Uncharacterized protein n=1 Tax=Selaginella moellendorffii TaxID=88036 RepID=D8TCB5_SELML|nr:hypothetical protein SELMODRAFT_431352 [Selaginella moellendorffii]